MTCAPGHSPAGRSQNGPGRNKATPGMLRAGAGLAVAVALAPAMAHADTSIAVENALFRFQTACPTALTDPDTYIASLTLPGPAGEEGVYASPDGRYVLVHTTQTEGLTDKVELVELADRQLRRCRISAVLPDLPEAGAIAKALLPLLDGHEVIGGETPQVEPIWDPGDTPVAYEGEPRFEYFAMGLLPGLDTPAEVAAQYGEVVFYAARSVPRKEMTE